MEPLVTKEQLISKHEYKNNIIKKIDSYKWLPLYPSKELARIAGDLFGDGHLQGGKKWRFDFTSKSKEELVRFGKEIQDLFGAEGKIRACTTNIKYVTYNYGVNNKAVAISLFLAGVPYGAKVTKPYKLPKWILEDKECFVEFCKRFFTCEGSIFADGNHLQVRLEIWKSDDLLNNCILFMKSISNGLNDFFKIKSTITTPKHKCSRTDDILTKSVRIYINKKDIIKFYEKIGFEGEKQEKLKKAIKLHFSERPG